VSLLWGSLVLGVRGLLLLLLLGLLRLLLLLLLLPRGEQLSIGSP